MKKIILIFFLSLNLCFSNSFEDGVKAYNKVDYKNSVEIFKTLANRKDVNVQYFFGIMYEKGLDVQKDYKKAIKYYIRAVNQGQKEAKTTLKLMNIEIKKIA